MYSFILQANLLKRSNKNFLKNYPAISKTDLVLPLQGNILVANKIR